MKYLSLFFTTLFLSSTTLAADFYNFSCTARLDNRTDGAYHLIDATQTELTLELHPEVSVNLKRVNNHRLLISMKSTYRPDAKPVLLDGAVTQQLAMSSGGSTVICYSHLVESNN